MTDNQKTDEEPSIEEILSSIRDIISDEDEDSAPEAPFDDSLADLVKDADAPTETLTSPELDTTEFPVSDNDTPNNEDDDILDLSNFEQETNDNIDASIMAEAAAEDDNDPLSGIDLGHSSGDDLQIDDIMNAEPEQSDDGLSDILSEDDNEAVEAEVQAIVDEEPMTEEVSPIIDDVQDETEGLVNAVAETATVGAMAKLAEKLAISKNVEGITLEDIVRDLLKPMLKEWLDENLPNTIDRLVSKELERLAEKAIRK